MNLLASLLIALACAVLGFYAGDDYRNSVWEFKQLDVLYDHQTRLQFAQAKGDELAQKLLAAQTKVSQLQSKAHHDLQTTTTGTACLNAATVRVLSNQTPGLIAPSLPSAPSVVDAEGSTDAQVANWIADATSAYEQCANQLNALIDWESKR